MPHYTRGASSRYSTELLQHQNQIAHPTLPPPPTPALRQHRVLITNGTCDARQAADDTSRMSLLDEILFKFCLFIGRTVQQTHRANFLFKTRQSLICYSHPHLWWSCSWLPFRICRATICIARSMPSCGVCCGVCPSVLQSVRVTTNPYY